MARRVQADRHSLYHRNSLKYTLTKTSDMTQQDGNILILDLLLLFYCSSCSKKITSNTITITKKKIQAVLSEKINFFV